MHRREALKQLGVAAAALPFLRDISAEELLAFGERAHRRLVNRTAGYMPNALDAHQFRTVTAVSELIMPETDTPGATAAGVDRFVDLIVGEWYDEDERARFLTGLGDLDARSRAAFQGDFADGTIAQQTAVLERLEEEALALREENRERAASLFYPTMKWLTLFGYYTSQIGATDEHHFVTIPGAYRGCEPYAAHVHG